MGKDIHPHPGPFKDWYTPANNNLNGLFKRPFYRFEWGCEIIEHHLSRWAFLQVLKSLSTLGILLGALLTGHKFYLQLKENKEQVELKKSIAVAAEEEKNEAKKALQNQAWTLIHLADGQIVSGGRILAMEELARDGVSMAGINLNQANLRGANLSGADLEGATLREADLAGANLGRTNLRGGDLRGTNLREAYLRGTNLSGANLEGAYLEGSNLNGANIFGLKNTPSGFREWALENGAVEIESHKEWEALKKLIQVDTEIEPSASPDQSP